jgi:hypothetical protein
VATRAGLLFENVNPAQAHCQKYHTTDHTAAAYFRQLICRGSAEKNWHFFCKDLFQNKKVYT